MDFTWFKSAGLAAVQNFAHAILGVFGGQRRRRAARQLG
ncbi:hypothetical protein MYXE_19720 [Mycobacterium xenopi]|uniref:Uncharacterized protein n=1 Tax=Mycobacterium xenopi TaxID=1789 RepID=A0AAD1GZR2_MYCXE|nr:hypothetical protein MYXE_19720 [Mycobacterium xenopi]